MTDSNKLQPMNYRLLTSARKITCDGIEHVCMLSTLSLTVGGSVKAQYNNKVNKSIIINDTICGMDDAKHKIELTIPKIHNVKKLEESSVC